MLIGLQAGNMLRSGTAPFRLVKRFVLIGIGLIMISVLLHYTGICPIVKRIWTPAWVIFSAGCCFLLLSFFYGIIDAGKYRKWAFFLIVVGTNSIAAYVLADGFSSFITNSLYIHLGQNFDHLFGEAYRTLVKGALVLLIEWLILYQLYVKKIFIRIWCNLQMQHFFMFWC